MAPAGTPAPVLDYVDRAVNAVLAQPGMQAEAGKLGLRLTGGTRGDFEANHAAIEAHYTRIIREEGIRPAN